LPAPQRGQVPDVRRQSPGAGPPADQGVLSAGALRRSPLADSALARSSPEPPVVTPSDEVFRRLADDDVDIHYGEMRLQADHVEYNNATYEALARGHVQFDFENQHLEGDDAQLNIQTGHGTFHNVHGNVKLERHPNPTLLITENPVYFEAKEVERMSAEVYLVRHSWFTICDPQHPFNFPQLSPKSVDQERL
jgi:LPS-assembly protein